MKNASYYMLLLAAGAIGSTMFALLCTMWGVIDADNARSYVLVAGPIGIASFIGSWLTHRRNV